LRPAQAKVNETPMSANKLGLVAHASGTSYMVGINRRIIVQVGPGKNMRLFKK
jgi:hypothetical protein